MPKPKTSSGYSQTFFNLLELASKKDEFELKFPDKKKAESFRFRFYAFREALKRDLKKEKLPERKEIFQEQVDIAVSMTMKLRKEGDEVWLDINPAKKITDEMEIDINAQIFNQMVPEEDVSGFVADEYAHDSESSLDV